MKDIESLRVEYLDVQSKAERLKGAVVAELSELFQKDGVVLGVPIESRVKSWESISEKFDRKNIELPSIVDLDDLIGIRVILLFKKDLDSVHDIISKNFNLLRSEDTGERLGESEFGYQSHHYIVRVPSSWLSVPSWAGFGGFALELQVRTLAQHIWAAASHKLQYKQESGVPKPIRRTINRVSALLETVDLELQRVLDERVVYKEHAAEGIPVDGAVQDNLNVDSLAVLLAEIFPSANKAESENYSELLDDMFALGVTSSSQARDIFVKRYSEVMAKEKEFVKAHPGYDKAPDSRPPGVYLKHVGLGRQALKCEFGSSAVNKLGKMRKLLTNVSG